LQVTGKTFFITCKLLRVRTRLWVFPRGLITAVLAIQVLNAQGRQFDFLPALAFATIVVTNILVIFGSIRAKRGGRPPAELTPVVTSQNASR
jgi:hypothetical protein